MKRVLLSLGVAALMSVSVAAFAQNYPDVPTGHWAYEAIDSLTQQGVLKGYPDGKFKGKTPLTRYEFAVAIRDALNEVQKRIDDATSKLNSKIDGIKPATPESKPALTAEQEQALASIPDLAAQLKKLQEEGATLRRLATEFQDELASMGVDVESVKKDLADLSKRVKAIEADMARFKLSGDVSFVVKGSNGIDHKRAIDQNGQRTNLTGLLSDTSVLHELGLNISSKLNDTASADVTLIVGNYLPYLGSASQPGLGNTSPNTDIALWKAAVNTPVSVFGSDLNLTIGRFENRVTPLTLWRQDLDVYVSDARYDDGYYSMDGIKGSLGLGPVNLTAYAAKNNTITDNNNVNFMAVVAGSTSAVSPRTAHPSGANAYASIDQSAGVTLDTNIGSKVKLGGSYLSFATPRTPTSFGTANRVNVYDANLKADLIDRLSLTAEYAQSDLYDGTHSRNTKDNYALVAGLGYAFNENLGLNVGYREIRPLFSTPGYWGRIGYWVNPTDIKGVDVAADWKFGAFGLNAKGGFYKGTGRATGTTGFGDDDEINQIVVGAKWNATEKMNVSVDYETVLWNLKDTTRYAVTGKPVENYVTLGLNYNMGENTALKLLYQVIDFNAKGVTAWQVDGQDKARGGVAVAQFSVKF